MAPFDGSRDGKQDEELGEIESLDQRHTEPEQGEPDTEDDGAKDDGLLREDHGCLSSSAEQSCGRRSSERSFERYGLRRGSNWPRGQLGALGGEDFAVGAASVWNCRAARGASCPPLLLGVLEEESF